jgi:MarR family transcriptional regulator, organic hydroperoxide resistance regulator
MADPDSAVLTTPAADISERSFSVLVRRAHRVFVRLLGADLAAWSLTVAEWSVLRQLWHQEGITQVELAERLGVQKAALTAILDSLERKDILKRNRNEHDRRKMVVCLTEQGRALKKVLLPYGVKNNVIAVRGIDPADVETATRVLEQIIDNLGSEQS